MHHQAHHGIGVHHGGGGGGHHGGGHGGHHHHGGGGRGYWPGAWYAPPAPVYVSACPELYDPVIGTNGVTYANSCYANQAGVAVAGPAPRNFPARTFAGEDPGGVPKTSLTTREKLGLAAVTIGVIGLSYATYRAYSSPRRSLGLAGTTDYHGKEAAEAKHRATWIAKQGLQALREYRCGAALMNLTAFNYNRGQADAHRNTAGIIGNDADLSSLQQKFSNGFQRRCSIKGKKSWKMPKR